MRCSEQLQFCQGKDIWIDFRDLEQRKKELIRYNTDVLKRGQIKARCEYDDRLLKKNLIHLGPLQSWGAELQNFQSLDKNEIAPCDVRIERPTFIMKIDATVNMYHHFCDFFNLYASLHINGSINNQSEFDENTFNRNVNVLIWENIEYRSSLSQVFDAFTQNPILNLNTFAGKRVCFKNVVFPLLPRMLFGLFYNTPLTPNECHSSGLFKAFSDFITHRLNVPKPQVTNSRKINVTILSRQTKHRRILNLGTLERTLLDHGGFEVTIAPFTHKVPFDHQMKIIRTTDILVGIHGAGLTHMLFLPDWAAVFELYDCDDPSCYRDLARLKGVKHLSWSKMDKLTPEVKALAEHEHPGVSAKFTNYAFDPDEFLVKMIEAAEYVKNHPDFKSLDVNSAVNGHDEL